MKLNIYKSLMVALLMVVVFTSCEDYLTEVDPNGLTTDSYWRNLKDTDAGITATYSTLLNHFIISLDAEGCRTDEGWPGYGRPTPNGNGKLDWYYNTYNNSSEEVGKKWNACYQGIFRANQVIKALNNLELTDAEELVEKDLQMAQARFLRGLFHFYLYSAYNKGEVIIGRSVPDELEEYYSGLSPAKEVRDFYLADLYFAFENLKGVSSSTTHVLGKATESTVATILGNSYLYENNLDSAMFFYNEVMSNKNLELVSGNDVIPGAECKMFSIKGENNSESIFEISYNLNHDVELNRWSEVSMHNRWAEQTASTRGPITPAWLVHTFKNEKLDPLDDRNYYVDETAPSGRTMRNVSLRSSASITCVEDTRSPWYGGVESVAEAANFSYNGWGFGMCRKYYDPALIEKEGWESGLNVSLNRLSEVYINMAECLHRTGETQKALDLINQVRARWGLVLLGTAGTDIAHTYDGEDYLADTDLLMNHIMYVEKPLETYLEGFSTRWFDLRRWGIAKERFEDLASRTYYGVDFTFIRMSDNKEVTEQRVSIVDVVDPGYTGKTTVIDNEYDVKALNYNPAIHDWLPIPNDETTSNSEID
ncbi:RagB/SusD family nutrient uptake outer membrane protein [Saccharicrinis aurantiacus]|uniref:RagB/SusD family nutrient uptake outer membrane protein n=1 Tax=Saccharicrinis aurantiacus TaxID=1849719 RepID=UPI0015C5514E|nr:RagB/SusD family nutrient uptake outer membrane protein [Saccharicrinis aurantiacus]